MKNTKLAALLSLLLLAGAQLSADTIMIGATDDRTASNADGPGAYLLDQSDGFLRTFGVDGYWRSALEFSLSGIAGPVTINSATLRLVDAGTQVDGTILIHGYTGDGVITLGDFGYSNLVASYNTVSSGGDHPHYLDVTAFIQAQLSGSSPYAGFMLRSQNEGLFQGADISSSEWYDPAYRPLLTIDYSASGVPDEGSSLALMGSALLVVAAFRRKFSRA